MFYVSNNQTAMDFFKKWIVKGSIIACLAGAAFGIWKFSSFVSDYEEYKKMPEIIKVLINTGQIGEAKQMLESMDLAPNNNTRAELEVLISRQERCQQLEDIIARGDYIAARELVKSSGNIMTPELDSKLLAISPDFILLQARSNTETDVKDTVDAAALWKAYELYEKLGEENKAKKHLIEYYINNASLPIKERFAGLFKAINNGNYDDTVDSDLFALCIDGIGARPDDLGEYRGPLLAMGILYAGDDAEKKLKVADAYVKESRETGLSEALDYLVAAKGIYESLGKDFNTPDFMDAIKGMLGSLLKSNIEEVYEKINAEFGLDAAEIYVGLLMDSSKYEDVLSYARRQDCPLAQEKKDEYVKNASDLHVRSLLDEQRYTDALRFLGDSICFMAQEKKDEYAQTAANRYASSVINKGVENESSIGVVLEYLNNPESPFTQEQRNSHKKRIADIYLRHYAVACIDSGDLKRAYGYVTRARNLYAEIGLGFDSDESAKTLAGELIKLMGGLKEEQNESASKKAGD